MLVPGIVNPVELSYGPLIALLKGDTNLMPKELEVYGGSKVPPSGYSVDTEADGIARAADQARVDTFHLVGYSAGGIAALGAIERYGARLRSVTLIEPFGTGSYRTSPEERAFLDYTAGVLSLPMEQRVAAFLPMNLHSGIAPPVQAIAPAPVWMESRPMGIAALIKSAIEARFDPAAFRNFRQPVYMVMGSESNRVWHAMAGTLSGLFPNKKVEIYEGLHHLSPPQRIQPERFAEALRTVWAEGDALMKGSE